MSDGVVVVQCLPQDGLGVCAVALGIGLVGVPDQVDVHRGHEGLAGVAGDQLHELEVPLDGGPQHRRLAPVLVVGADLVDEGQLSVHALDQVQRETGHVTAQRSDEISYFPAHIHRTNALQWRRQRQHLPAAAD